MLGVCLLCLFIIQQYLSERSWSSAVTYWSPCQLVTGTGWAFACLAYTVSPQPTKSTDKHQVATQKRLYHSNHSTSVSRIQERSADLLLQPRARFVQTTAHESKQDFCELHVEPRPGWSSVKTLMGFHIKSTPSRGLPPDTSWYLKAEVWWAKGLEKEWKERAQTSHSRNGEGC